MRLFQLARKHGAGGGRHTDAVEELKNAFELAERSSPGITNRCCARDRPSENIYLLFEAFQETHLEFSPKFFYWFLVVVLYPPVLQDCRVCNLNNTLLDYT